MIREEQFDRAIKALEQEQKIIVTCKDCKHWHDDGIMTTCDNNIGHGYPRDHFWADGEKRE